MAIDFQGRLGIGQLFDDLSILKADDIHAAPFFRSPLAPFFEGGPLESPPVQNLLGGFVYEEIFSGESKPPMGSEPWSPGVVKRFFSADPCAMPVLEKDIVMEEFYYAIEVVIVPLDFPVRHGCYNFVSGEFHRPFLSLEKG